MVCEREAQGAGAPAGGTVVADDALTGAVIGAAIAVHRGLGPGLLESSYRVCMAHELRLSGLTIEVERPIPVSHRGLKLDCGYRLDLLVEARLIVELKSVQRLDPLHVAQLLTYLRLTRLRLGLLINFNVPRLVDGVRRVVNGYPSHPP